MTDWVEGRLRSLEKSDYRSNLKKNWFLPVSSVFFFLLYGRSWLSYYIGIPVAVILVALLAMIAPPLLEKYSKTSLYLKLYAFLSALGVCYGSYLVYKPFVFRWGDNELMRLGFMVLAIPVVYVAVLAFSDAMLKLLSGHFRSSGIDRKEVLIYVILLLGLSGFVGYFFLQSPAFYGTSNPFDVIYTSDTPSIVRFNAYVLLNFKENDIRQPLFAVFAAPFAGIPSLLGSFTPDVFRAWILDIFQIAILLLTNVILAVKLQFTKIQRICFVLFFSFTHACLLFSLLMEQYIVAYFWIVLAIILVCDGKKQARLATCAAGGTLLTGLVLTPAIYPLHPQEEKKTFFKWIADMFRTGVEYLLLVFLFCRLDVLIDSVDNMVRLGKFSGESVSMSNRVMQYTHFVRNLFIAPKAGPVSGDWASWQLDPIGSFSILGVIILVVTLLCFALVWKDKMARFCGAWILFSMAVLIVGGWGTVENGLILYSLYFGWAFFVLLFLALKALEEKLKCKYIVPVLTLAAIAGMLVLNIPGFKDMLDFAVNAYPV